MKFFITGGCGFLGSNISAEVLHRKHTLIIFDDLSRVGSKDNLSWLQQKGDFEFIQGDVRIAHDIETEIATHAPDVVIHLAGQVSMTKSIEDPRKDFEINAVGTFNIIDSIRKYSPQAVLIYSSTNKVYGDLEWARYEEKEKRYEVPEFPKGFSESTMLQFSSPYGTSKGCADQYVLDAYRTFGIKTVVLRHSSMCGSRQFSTYDQGWVGWFCEKAIEQKNSLSRNPFTVSGNGKQVRDVLFADDMVNLYFSIIDTIDKTKGNSFNIGGGMANSLSICELLSFLEEELGIQLQYTHIAPRQSDQKVFVADISKITQYTGWTPKIDKMDGIRAMIRWINEK